MDSELQPPRCLILTGPRSPGRSRWLEERIAGIHREQPEARCAVLLADEGLTRTERFAATVPKVEVQCVFMPCLCCPAVAELPRAARRFVTARRPDWLFIELPALAAAGLIGEFDRVIGWRREVVIWLNREWSTARRARTTSLFQSRLLELADHVVEQPPARRGGSGVGAGGVATPTLSLI